jgi:hypothetical protein
MVGTASATRKLPGPFSHSPLNGDWDDTDTVTDIDTVRNRCCCSLEGEVLKVVFS